MHSSRRTLRTRQISALLGHGKSRKFPLNQEAFEHLLQVLWICERDLILEDFTVLLEIPNILLKTKHEKYKQNIYAMFVPLMGQEVVSGATWTTSESQSDHISPHMSSLVFLMCQEGCLS